MSMAAPTKTARPDPVRQFSVFTQNQVGRLHGLISLLRQSDIHVMAITVLDSVESAVVRMVVDDPAKARDQMNAHGFPYAESNLLAVELSTEADLKGVLVALLEAEINIHYVYSFIRRPGDLSALAICVEDLDIAAQAVGRRGYKVLDQGDISR